MISSMLLVAWILFVTACSCFWISEARADIRPTYLYQFERMVEAHQSYRAKINAEYVAEQARAVHAAAARKPAKKR